MGCGDGRLLATVWAFVREHRDLEAHPLTLIGVDFNAAALAEKTFGGPKEAASKAFRALRRIHGRLPH